MAWPVSTTTELLAAIRRAARLSANDPDWTTANLLLIADKQLQDSFWPFVMHFKADFGLDTFDYTITADQQAYALPRRAYGSTLRRVIRMGTAATDVEELPSRPMIADTVYSGSTGTPEAHCVHDDKVLLLPTPNATTGTLRVYYERRPSSLVATTSAMQITGGVDTGVLTGSAPTAWTTALQYDILKNTSPFATISDDLTASAVVGSTSITFALADLDTTRLAVGDWVVESGYSPIPQIPVELHSVLADAVSADVLSTIGSDSASARCDAKVAIAMRNFQRAVTPRFRGRGRPVYNPNSPFRARTSGARVRIIDDGLP